MTIYAPSLQCYGSGIYLPFTNGTQISVTCYEIIFFSFKQYSSTPILIFFNKHGNVYFVDARLFYFLSFLFFFFGYWCLKSGFIEIQQVKKTTLIKECCLKFILKEVFYFYFLFFFFWVFKFAKSLVCVFFLTIFSRLQWTLNVLTNFHI